MDADLDTAAHGRLLSRPTISCQSEPKNARRSVTDAEVVTLCVAQAIMGIPSDRRFLAVACQAAGAPVPEAARQPGYFKRRRRLADTLEWLMGVFASQSPGFYDDLLLVDSTPVECAAAARPSNAPRSPTPPTTATAPPTPAASGAFACTRSSPPTAHPARSRWPRPSTDEREVALELLDRCRRNGGETAGRRQGLRRPRLRRQRQPSVDATIVRPRRKDEPGRGPHLAPIRQRIESIFWTCKDLLTLERHGARTLAGLRERVLQRFLCLAACITLNHRLGRPSRALVNYCA